MHDLVRQTPRVVCILGMHRSGTSVVARLLNFAGVYLGPEAAIGAIGADNPTGFWEHRDFREINDRILERFEGTWIQPPDFPPGWERSSDLDDLRERARSLIDTFSSVPLWGFKDPRNSLTLPFWLTLLHAPSFVVCVRSPLSVAASLGHRNGISTADSLHLWRRYTVEALAHAPRNRRVIVHAERLFTDWEAVLSQVIDTLGLRGMRDLRELKGAASDFLRESLWHHRNPSQGVVASTAVSPATAALYLLLRDLQANDPSCGLISPNSVAELNDDALLRIALFYAWRDTSEEGAGRSIQPFHGPLATRVKLEERVRSKEDELARSHGELNLLQSRLEITQATLQATEAEIDSLQAQIEQLSESEKSLQQALAERIQELSVLRNEKLAAQERELAALRQQLAIRREELDRIRTSRWWRFMDRYWRLRRRIRGSGKT